MNSLLRLFFFLLSKKMRNMEMYFLQLLRKVTSELKSEKKNIEKGVEEASLEK